MKNRSWLERLDDAVFDMISGFVEWTESRLGALLALMVVVAIVLFISMVVSLSACATLDGEAEIVLPAETAQIVQAIAVADMLELVNHYNELYATGRAPTTAEYERWRLKYERAKVLYRQLLASIDERDRSHQLTREIGRLLFEVGLSQLEK